MNDPQQPSDPNQPHDPRPPVETDTVFTPPSPPPDQGYRYAAVPQPPQRRGVIATMGKVMGALFGAAALVALGFYLALFVAFASAEPVAGVQYRAGEITEKVAIIAVYGTIAEGNAEYVRLATDQVLKDETVKAVVIHVQSGGGLVGPSEHIHAHIQRMREKLEAEGRGVPVVASYESVAASGGYYVSCHADRIFADPTCITGSVGVLAQVPLMKDLFEEKLGVKMLVLEADSSPEKSIANDLWRDWDDRDISTMKDRLNAMHVRFKDIVRAGRVDTERMTAEQFETGTQGGAYMAEEALELGLIDEIGYIDDAIEYARKNSKIEAVNPMVVRYQVRPSGLMGMLTGAKTGHSVTLAEVSMDADNIRAVFNELSRPEVMFLYRP